MGNTSPSASLKWAIFGPFAAAIALAFGAMLVALPVVVEPLLLGTLTETGRALAREMALRVSAGPLATGKELLATAPAHIGEPLVAAAVVCRGPSCVPDDVVASSPGADRARLALLIDHFNSRGRAPLGQPLPAGVLLVSEPFSSDAGTGHLLVELPRTAVDKVLGRVRVTLLLGLAAALGLLAVLGAAASRQLIGQPVGEMIAHASRLADADLTATVGQRTGELGQLADALNGIGRSWRDTLARIRGVSAGLEEVIARLSKTGSAVSEGASTVLSRVEQTSGSMEKMISSLQGIAQNVEVLYQSAEESSSSILEMAATNDEVAESVQAMAASVQETASAIAEMTRSIKQVARSVEDLLSSADQTSRSMKEMDVSIGQVEVNATETAKLSEQVSHDAESGVLSLRKTLAGIDKIRDSSRTASEVIESLGRRIEEIGNVLHVIDEVAEQTNLLALNAAIIAAQAGEHGKGFAVVADEIKDLAERTGASTKEISDLIRAVQEASRKAVAAMNQGVRNVDEGVALGRDAESALQKIYDSANKSTSRVKAIASATVEQARGSKAVTSAIQRIAETVHGIAAATAEQARGSEQIVSTAEKMMRLTQHVQRSSEEQAHGSRQVTRSIENINDMLTELNRAQKEQTKNSAQMLQAVATIRSISEQQAHSVQELEEALASLRRQAETLGGEVGRFKL